MVWTDVNLDKVGDSTKIKMKNAEGEVICHITYNPKMNSLKVVDANKKFVKWVPLG